MPDPVEAPEWPETHMTDWLFQVGHFDEEMQTHYPPYYVMRLLTRVGEQLFTSAVSVSLEEMEAADTTSAHATLVRHKVHTALIALKDVVEDWIGNHAN